MFFNVQNLHVNLGEFYLEDVSLEIEQGDYLNVIGPTGAGKSILLESVIGFYKPDSGRIFLEGQDITNLLPEKRHMGIVYQDYCLLPHFTVYKNIAFGLKKVQKNGIQEKVQETAKALKIDHLLHRKPGTLSGGEQQRTALARSLAVEPKLLLMDEPFSALDPSTSQEIRRLLKEFIEKLDTTVIHITHNLEDVWALASKVAVLAHGHLLQYGPVNEIFQRPASPFVASFVGSAYLEAEVMSNHEATTLNINGLVLESRDKAQPGTTTKVAIRPEFIMISKRLPRNREYYNIIEAQVESFLQQGALCSVFLQTEFQELQALVTCNVIARLNLKPGDAVYAMIKHEHVRIVPDKTKKAEP
jgi:molybdate transport system ATP-binding protein